LQEEVRGERHARDVRREERDLYALRDVCRGEERFGASETPINDR
jgi:hypothetical protein